MIQWKFRKMISCNANKPPVAELQSSLFVLLFEYCCAILHCCSNTVPYIFAI